MIRNLFTYFILLSLFIPVLTLQAENKIILKDNHVSELNVTEYLYILEDKDKSFDIEQIILSLDSAFTLNKTPNVNFGFTKSAYWVKFTIKNASESFKNLVFSIGYPFINHVDFYEITETQLTRKIHTGEAENFKTRDLQHRDFVFDLELLPQKEYTYIVRVYNDGETLRLPLRLASYKEYMSKDSIDLILKGFFYGLLVFVIIFNIFLFITIKDRLYVFYTLYVATLTLFIANTDGISFQLFWPDFPWWADRSTILFVSLSNLFLILFTWQFLVLDGLGKVVDITLKILFGFACILAVMSFMGPPIRVYAVMSANALSFFAIVVVIIIAIHALRKKVYGAKYFLASFMLLMIGVVIYVMRNMGVLPSNLLTGYGVKIGFVSEVLLLSFAASDRFRVMKDNINYELEKMVKLRTNEIQRQKEEIMAQRDEIEAQRDLATRQRDVIVVQQKELTDSIHYARNIQKSLLPSQNKISGMLGESFITYWPKDIVSGDFYWVSRKDNRIAIAVGDCTGHGIPGAFMSMLGISYLNELYSATWFLKPNEVLDRLREHIIFTLQQNKDFSEKTAALSKMRDGMDISICIIDTETLNVQFAGANNSLFVIKTEVELSNLIELKGDKMPISVHERMDPFNMHEIQLKKGDAMYIMTDGFADQFGGPEGRKFMNKQIKKMIETSSAKTMLEQKQIFENTLKTWQGNLYQVDDITFLGVRL